MKEETEQKFQKLLDQGETEDFHGDRDAAAVGAVGQSRSCSRQALSTALASVPAVAAAIPTEVSAAVATAVAPVSPGRLATARFSKTVARSIPREKCGELVDLAVQRKGYKNQREQREAREAREARSKDREADRETRKSSTTSRSGNGERSRKRKRQTNGARNRQIRQSAETASL